MAEVVVIPLWDKASSVACARTTPLNNLEYCAVKSAEMAEVVKALV